MPRHRNSRAQRGRPPARSASVFAPDRLLEALTRSGMSIAALEKRVLADSNVHATVADYLGGTRPSAEVLHALAKALNCSMESFFIQRGT
jgi:transcriptional regulator with XRE-family HTH domain